MTGQGGKLNHGRSASQATAAPQRQNSLPPSLRSSNSLANVDLYVAPYEQQGSHSSALDQVASELGELSVSDRHRSESISVCRFSSCDLFICLCIDYRRVQVAMDITDDGVPVAIQRAARHMAMTVQ